jgi:P-type E1-E2 ATPase
VLDSFLFSLALAVGLTPQLLPAIVSINLASGARRMADKKVIVKRLSSIENFGSMNVLCTDKTGTLTKGEVTLQSVTNLEGKESQELTATEPATAPQGFGRSRAAVLRERIAATVVRRAPQVMVTRSWETLGTMRRLSRCAGGRGSRRPRNCALNGRRGSSQSPR